MDAEHKQLQSDMARMKKSSQDNVEHHEKLSHELISGLTSRMTKLEEQQVPKKELRKPQSHGWRQQGRETFGMDKKRLGRAAQLKLKRQEIEAALGKEALEKEMIEIKAALGKDKFEHLAAAVAAAVAAVAAEKVHVPGKPWSSEHMGAALRAAINEIEQAADQMEKDNFERKKMVFKLKEYFFQQSANKINRSCIDFIFRYV